jgi:cytidylate kinase
LTGEPPSTPEPTQRAAPAALIAIDGPVASGKTSVGLKLARRLGYRLVDTGMMYRAVTWLAHQRGIDVMDAEGLTRLAHAARIELGRQRADGSASILVDGRDVTDDLRQPEIDRNVSYVSQVAGVREAMVERQRRFAREGGLIMLGRDIGTVVLPDAPVKVYLDASTAERAKRRYLELKETGRERPEAEIRTELEKRDEMDRTRHLSPLLPAADAHIVDTDGLDLDEVVERILVIAGGAA